MQNEVANGKFKWMVETVIAVQTQRKERLLWATVVRENSLEKVEFEEGFKGVNRILLKRKGKDECLGSSRPE